MRYRPWFLALLCAFIVVGVAVLVASHRDSSPPALASAVVVAWLLACAYKALHAGLTHVHVVGGTLVYRDRLFRERRRAVSQVRKLKHITGARLEVAFDDGHRLVFDPRLMTNVHPFIETLSSEVTRHRTLLVSGDLE